MTRLSPVTLYQIDENEFGEFLLAMPDLGAATDAATFMIEKNDMLLLFNDGDIVRLPDIPRDVLGKLVKMPEMTIVELDQAHTPVRCYLCTQDCT